MGSEMCIRDRNKRTRARNLNAYINNLQRQLGNKGKLSKPIYLKRLSQTNSNVSLANIKASVQANAQRILRTTATQTPSTAAGTPSTATRKPSTAAQTLSPKTVTAARTQGATASGRRSARPK